jgi:hypothetical protein
VFGRTRTRAFGAAIALVVAGASLVPLAATSAGAQTPSVLNCNVTTYRLLFWPQGHGKVKSQGFPEYKVPHVELYTGTGTKYPDSESLGYVDSAGQKSNAPSCTAATLTGTTGGAIPPAKLKTLTKTSALACSAPSAAVIIVPTPAKASLSLAITGQSVASAVMSGTGSQLQYDSSMCKPQKAPK